VGLSVVLTLTAIVFLVPWLGSLAEGVSNASLLELIPWKTLLPLALAAANCTLRVRLIVRRDLSQAGA
jgi:hypothetical protein